METFSIWHSVVRQYSQPDDPRTFFITCGRVHKPCQTIIKRPGTVY